MGQKIRNGEEVVKKVLAPRYQQHTLDIMYSGRKTFGKSLL